MSKPNQPHEHHPLFLPLSLCQPVWVIPLSIAPPSFPQPPSGYSGSPEESKVATAASQHTFANHLDGMDRGALVLDSCTQQQFKCLPDHEFLMLLPTSDQPQSLVSGLICGCYSSLTSLHATNPSGRVAPVADAIQYFHASQLVLLQLPASFC